MTFEHKKLADGGWDKLSTMEQMANIGSEVERAMNWREKKNEKYAQLAFYRALELFDLSSADAKNLKRLREILRARELFADFFSGAHQYISDRNSWQKYFYSYNYAVRS